MALRGIQEYIARDVNNIARVEDEGNVVSIQGNIFLYPPNWSHKVRAILKKYCPPSQSAWNTRFYFGHQKLCMDNIFIYWACTN